MLTICIRNENRKLHHSIIWFACFLLPIIPAVIGTFNYLGNLDVLTNTWYSLWTQHTIFYANFFYAPLIALYASYLWRLEHFQHNWNHLMTMPVPISCLFLGKLAILIKVTVFTQLWMMLLYVLGGKLAGLEGLPPLPILLWALRGTLAVLAVGPLHLLLSMVIRNFAIPIGIALAGSIVGLMAANGSELLCFFCPWSLMLLGMNSNRDVDVLGEGPFGGASLLYIFSNLLFFLLFTALAIHLLSVSDVRAE